MNWHDRVDLYLEVEGILNRVFSGFGYCLTQCIQHPRHGGIAHCGCCQGPYYKLYDLDHPAFHLLTTRRTALYGPPEGRALIKRVSPCEYHTLKGCVLKTHKSPVCIGFLCRDGIEALRSGYNLWTYDYLGITHGLEWILTGDLTGRALEAFRKTCLDMTETIENLKTSPKPPNPLSP